MNDTEEYKIARRTARRKVRFYIHLITYLIVGALLITINLVTAPKYFWFIWPMAGWGVGLVLHGIKISTIPQTSSIMEKMIEQEIKRQEKP